MSYLPHKNFRLSLITLIFYTWMFCYSMWHTLGTSCLRQAADFTFYTNQHRRVFMVSGNYVDQLEGTRSWRGCFLFILGRSFWSLTWNTGFTDRKVSLAIPWTTGLCSLLFMLYGMLCLSMYVPYRDPRHVILCRCFFLCVCGWHVRATARRVISEPERAEKCMFFALFEAARWRIYAI